MCPVDSGFRYYMQTYPVLTFGGTEPFMSKGEVIPDNVTAIGSLDVARAVVDREVAIAITMITCRSTCTGRSLRRDRIAQ